MSELNFARHAASKRKAERDGQHAGTLVHYLGVQMPLRVCRDGARQAIIEQQQVPVAG